MSELLYEGRGAVGYVTLNRPQARNALTFAMYEGLAEICREITPDGPIKVLVITGAGDDAFAAGTDMKQFRAFSEPQDALDYEGRIDTVLTDIEKCCVPTIAAITGACTGGGAGIASCCDIRISDTRLRFGFPIARTLGNCLSISSMNRLSELLGASRLREILLTARLVEADEAHTIGLVSEVLDSPSAVRDRAGELAEKLTNHAPLSMRASKEGLRRLREASAGLDDTDLILSCYMSGDFKEGIEAFLGKRKPVWKGN